MFKKKKLYKIVYQLLNTYTAIIDAKDVGQATKKLHKMHRYGYQPKIISIEVYKLDA
jgi:hypothetical protein